MLVDKSTLSLENSVEEMGSHQKKESSGKAKRKRTSLEGSQENEVKSPKKLRKGGKLNNLCKIRLGAVSYSTMVGGFEEKEGNSANGKHAYKSPKVGEQCRQKISE